jgi:hypothetical protein
MIEMENTMKLDDSFSNAHAKSKAAAGKPVRRSELGNKSESEVKASKVPDKSTMPTAHTPSGALQHSVAQMKDSSRIKAKVELPVSSQVDSELHAQPKSGESVLSPAGSKMNRTEMAVEAPKPTASIKSNQMDQQPMA